MTAAYKCKIVVFSLTALCCLFMSFAASGQTILASSTAKHVFSDPKIQDVFKLTIRGTSLLKADAIFEIVSSPGKVLYHETFKAYSLSNELETEGFSQKQEEEYIRKRVREFFNEKHFLKPAVRLKDKTDSDYSDMTVWNELRANKAAIGFQYLLSYENDRKIAYSKRLGKVVTYWSCC